MRKDKCIRTLNLQPTSLKAQDRVRAEQCSFRCVSRSSLAILSTSQRLGQDTGRRGHFDKWIWKEEHNFPSEQKENYDSAILMHKVFLGQKLLVKRKKNNYYQAVHFNGKKIKYHLNNERKKFALSIPWLPQKRAKL